MARDGLTFKWSDSRGAASSGGCGWSTVECSENCLANRLSPPRGVHFGDTRKGECLSVWTSRIEFDEERCLARRGPPTVARQQNRSRFPFLSPGQE